MCRMDGGCVCPGVAGMTCGQLSCEENHIRFICTGGGTHKPRNAGDLYGSTWAPAYPKNDTRHGYETELRQGKSVTARCVLHECGESLLVSSEQSAALLTAHVHLVDISKTHS